MTREDSSGNVRITPTAYRELISRVRDVVCRAVPADATVVVINKGDEELLKLGGRRALHFPQMPDGRYSGYYPAKSAEAVAQLEALRAKGADFLVVPSAAFWWFDHYLGFKAHLENRYRISVGQSDSCVIFALGESEEGSRALDRSITIDQAIKETAFSAAIPIEALQLERAGRVEQACQILRTALSRSPDSIFLIDEYLRMSRSAWDLRVAEEVLLKATAGSNDVPEAHLMLAEVSLALGDLARAMAAAQHAVELDPDRTKAWKILAAIRGLRRTPADTRDLIELVKLERSSGKAVLAEHYAVGACAMVPDDHALNLELAQLELRQGRLSAAEQRFTHLVALRPSDPAILDALMELFCQRIEDHEIDLPGGSVDSALLERFLAQLRVPGRNKLISARTHLRIAETLGRVNVVEPALVSLASALDQLDFNSETLRNFVTRLLGPVVTEKSLIPFTDKRALASFLTHLGNGFAAASDAYHAQACYHLAAAADTESWAARFNLAFLDIARGDVLNALQRLKGAAHIPADQAALIAWPARDWPHGAFTQGNAFEKLKPAGASWPKITVITPSFNQASDIEDTLLSVLNQGYPALEYIVVDGASTDGTRGVLRQYKTRLTKLIIEPAKGQADALNKGLRLATGEIVLRVDPDGMLAPGAVFMVALAYLEEGTDVIAGFCLEHTDHRFESISSPAATQATFNVECLGDIFEYWLRGHYFHQPAVAFSRRILQRVGGKLDETLSHFVDYEFWLRCAAAGGRLSVVSWPIGLCRTLAKDPADLTERVLEQSQVRDRFVVPEPSLARKLEVRQRLGQAFAQTIPEIAVVSTRAPRIFSPDTAREIKDTFADGSLSVNFYDDLEAAAQDKPDLIVLLVHLYQERHALRTLRETGYQGAIVGWFWDNHHLIFDNYEEAKDLDVCIPGHAFAADYLRSRRYLMGAPVPLCTTQWSGEEAGTFFDAHGLAPRSHVLYGGFVRHATAGKRNVFVHQLMSAGMEGVYLLEKDTLQRYFGMPLEERFKTWSSHKASICLPLSGDLSQRLFDSLLTGQIPIVPSDIHDLDSVIPRRLQTRLPIVRMSDYTPDAVQEAHARAIHLFEKHGKAGILRRHRFALQNHRFASRIATIISDLRTTAGIVGPRLAPRMPIRGLQRRNKAVDSQGGASPVTPSGVSGVSNGEDMGIGFSTLLHEAKAVNKNLVEAINSGKNILFLRCEPGPCCAALYHTLEVLRSHHPSFSKYVVLADNVLEPAYKGAAPDSSGHVLFALRELLDTLSSRARGTELKGIGDLAERLASGDRNAVCLSLSARSLAREAIEKAVQFSHRLVGTFEPAATSVSGSCLVTSLYDERNLLRLIEYLACVVENLKVFERVAIFYESTDGLLSTVIQEIVEELLAPPGRLLLVPYQKRPLFEELFALRTTLADGTVVAVANADVAFDASFAQIKQLDLSKHIVVLSRYDMSGDGSKAALIHFDNGFPNTFSADAWIFSTPFEEDFFLDYPIGSFHCDSFINHQISRSSRYGALNPCHDIRVFHLHDDRFNSSAEKQTRDSEKIQKTYASERERNGGIDPLRGVAWSTLATAAIVPSQLQFQTWKYKGLLFDLAGSSRPTFACLLIIHYLLSEVSNPLKDTAVVVKLRKADLNGTLGLLFAQYQKYFSPDCLLLDTDGHEIDLAESVPDNVATKTVCFDQLADRILNTCSDSDWEQLLWPAVPGTLLRCDVIGDISTELTASLLGKLKQHSASLSSLFGFFRSLPDHSSEKRLLAPFIVPLIKSAPAKRGAAGADIVRPRVSFVTSLFGGGTFLPGYLHNVALAAKEADGEVIIVDADDDDHDSRVVTGFMDQHPAARNRIDYIRLGSDPGLYECWRIAIERAKADLITNANIDDRRCPSHTARLVELLKSHPEYAGTCGSIACVTAEGTGDWFTLYDSQLWFFGDGLTEIGLRDLYRVNERGEVVSRNVMHCMPVWRKSLHERYGYFDEKTYGTSADWAFWLKCAKAGEKFLFDETAFGRYFLNPESHNRRNDPQGVKERRIISDFFGVEQAEFAKQ